MAQHKGHSFNSRLARLPGRDLSSDPDPDSENSESIVIQPERVSLLSPGAGSNIQQPNYKTASLGVLASEPHHGDEEAGAVELQNSRSVLGILSLLFIGVFIANADGTIVMATYGTISSEFGAFDDASWLTTSFSLAACAVQPLAGKLSDIYGRKIVLLVSYFWFGVGCVICGIATSFWQVIAGRILSGIGAAGMTVLVSVLITDLVPMIQIASWRSYVNLLATLGRSIGGPIGGVLADTIGWRWAFAGQGPLLTIAIMLVSLKLPGDTLPPISQQKDQPSKLRRVDFIGALTLAGTIVCLLGALSLGGQSYPWSHPYVISPIAFSFLLGFLFVRWENRYALEPIFPPGLVIQRDVATGYAIMTLQVAAQTSMMFTVPLYFKATQNSTNTAAGSHLFPAVVGNAVGSLIAGFLIQKTGKFKNLTIIATMFSSACYLIMILRWKQNITTLESLEIIQGGFGQGIAQATTFIHLTSSVQADEMAMATGGMYLSSSIGMVVSLAICSSIQMGSLNVLLQEGLRNVAGASQIIQTVISDVGSIAKLEEPIQKIVIENYVKSLEYSHMWSLFCSLAALGLAFTMREHRLK